MLILSGLFLKLKDMRKFIFSTILVFSLAIGAVAGNIPMAKPLERTRLKN